MVLALAAHAGLIAWLALKPPAAAPLPAQERMTVTLSDDVGLTSTSPEPQAQAAPDKAPEIGEAPPPPAPEPKVIPKPEPPRPVVRPEARPQPKPAPRPVIQQPRPQPKPVVRPQTAAQPRPATNPRPAHPQATRPQQTSQPSRTTPTTQPQRTAQRPGGSRIGDDFLKGVSGATTNGASRTPPAATIGPAVRSALSQAISRQLKPKWSAPQGIDADQLVTILAWDLNADGTLASQPRVVRQEGITASNRAQAQRHAEQAIRAVRLAAPFDLPDQYFSAWQHITSFRFDRKLSQ